MSNEHIMYAVVLISIWIWLRFKIDQVGKTALKYLGERNSEFDTLEGNRFSTRLVSYIAEMKNYKSQLLKDKMSTQPVMIFWLLLTIMISILSVLLFLYVQIFHLST